MYKPEYSQPAAGLGESAQFHQGDVAVCDDKALQAASDERNVSRPTVKSDLDRYCVIAFRMLAVIYVLEDGGHGTVKGFTAVLSLLGRAATCN